MTDSISDVLRRAAEQGSVACTIARSDVQRAINEIERLRLLAEGKDDEVVIRVNRRLLPKVRRALAEQYMVVAS